MIKETPENLKLQTIMTLINRMASLAASADMEFEDEDSFQCFKKQMNELDEQLKSEIGRGISECEPFLDYSAYTTLEMAAKRVLLPPEQSDLVQLMEERLSPYGFQFSNFRDFRWTFHRVSDNQSQEVIIQGNYSHEFLLELYSKSLGAALRIREITNHNPAYPNDFLRFTSEQERMDALNTIADIVIRYGIDKFQSSSL